MQVLVSDRIMDLLVSQDIVTLVDMEMEEICGHGSNMWMCKQYVDVNT